MDHESDKGKRPKRPGKKHLHKGVKRLVAAVVGICLWACITAYCVSADGKRIGEPGFIQAWCGFGIVLLGSLLVWAAVACFFAPKWIAQLVYSDQDTGRALRRLFGVALLMSAVGVSLIIIGIFAFDLSK